MDRRWLVAVAIVLAGTGVAGAAAIAPNAWAVDAHRNLQAARDLAAGQFGRQEGYLYSPMAAALTVPVTLLPDDIAIAAWLAIRLAVLAAMTGAATRRLVVGDRLLIGVAVIGFLPVTYDLELGNVTILVAGALAVVAWDRDRLARGILMGIVLATVPKPQLVPVLIWMMVWRPRAFVGAGLVAVGLTAIGVIVLGIGPYQAWGTALRAPPYLSGSARPGDFALWVLPIPVAIVAAAATVVATLLALRRDPNSGLLATTAAGLLLAPYTIAYAAALLLVPAREWARRAPRATAVLALTSPIVLPVFLQAWAAGCLAVAVTGGFPARGEGTCGSPFGRRRPRDHV